MIGRERELCGAGGNRTRKDAHIDDPLIQQLAAPEGEEEGLHAAVAGEEIHGAHVGVLGEFMVASGEEGEGGRRTELVQDELEDFVCGVGEAGNEPWLVLSRKWLYAVRTTQTIHGGTRMGVVVVKGVQSGMSRSQV